MKITACLLGVIFAFLTPCPVDINVTIDGNQSFYSVSDDTFTWKYMVTTTGCISNAVDWYVSFNHIDPYDYMVSLGISGTGHIAGTRQGSQTLPNAGINVTTCDKLAIWGYAECPWHPDKYTTDLDYAPIRIKP